MQVTEISNEGLYREYKVVVPASSIAEQVSVRLAGIAKTANMPGFRKGKVPLNVLKKRYNTDLLEEVLRDLINSTSRKLYADHNLRPATEPDIQIANFNEGENLEYTVSLETFPDVTLPDFTQINLEKLVPAITEDDVNEGLTRLAGYYKKFVSPATPKAAAIDDEVVIDYEGTIEGVPFDGGKAEGFHLKLGSGQFIEGFEEQLVGSTAGEIRTVNVTFPEAYHHAPLAGKAAVFQVTVNDVLEGIAPEIDDAFAAQFSLENVDKLKEVLKGQIEKDCQSVARTKVKKELFDALETLCGFPVPNKMVENEFNTLWESAKQEEGELDASKSEEEQKQEYRHIAERRVKLGILMAEISRVHNLTVRQDEIQKAIYAQTRSYPGQEHAVVDFYRKNPAAVDQLKGPILEDKAVDFVLAQATLTDKELPVKDLMQALDKVEG